MSYAQVAVNRFLRYTFLVSRGNSIRLIVTVASLSILAIFLVRLDWSGVAQALRSSSPTWLVAAAGFTLANLTVKAIRFRVVSRGYGLPLTFRGAFAIQTAGIGLGMVTPGRVGEAVKVSFLADRGLPTSAGFGVVIFERLFDVTILGLLGLTLPFTLPNSPLPPWLAVVILVIAVVAIGMLIRFRRIPAFFPQRLREMLLRGLPPPEARRPGRIASVVGLTFLAWAIEAMTQVTIFHSLGIAVPFITTIGVMAASTLAGVASFLPGGFGVLDLSLVGLYGLVGVARENAVAFVGASRVINTLFPVLLSLPFFLGRRPQRRASSERSGE